MKRTFQLDQQLMLLRIRDMHSYATQDACSAICMCCQSCLAPLSDALAGSQAGAGPKKGSP